MNTCELKEYFKKHLVPSSLYSLQKNRTGRICLKETPEGWAVYFFEKAGRIGTLLFPSENDACRCMLREIGKVMEAVYGLSFTDR